MFDLIGFDADDTLWQNEVQYTEARDRFRAILGDSLPPTDLDELVEEIEIANLEDYGYGVKSFVLSLMEAAVKLTQGAVTGQQIQELLALGKDMLTAEVELHEDVVETLEALAFDHPLMLVTKGDLLHQQSKVARSGLASYFRYIEVVSRKDPHTYADLLRRHGTNPDRFLMVGNSLRSDVLPVVEIGGSAVHVPHALTWSHELADPPEGAAGRYFELERLRDLPGLVAQIEARAP